MRVVAQHMREVWKKSIIPALFNGFFVPLGCTQMLTFNMRAVALLIPDSTILPTPMACYWKPFLLVAIYSFKYIFFLMCCCCQWHNTMRFYVFCAMLILDTWIVLIFPAEWGDLYIRYFPIAILRYCTLWDCALYIINTSVTLLLVTTCDCLWPHKNGSSWRGR